MSAPFIGPGGSSEQDKSAERRQKLLARQQLLARKKNKKANIGKAPLVRATNLRPGASPKSFASPRQAGSTFSFGETGSTATRGSTGSVMSPGRDVPGGLSTPLRKEGKTTTTEVEKNLASMGISTTYDPTPKKDVAETKPQSLGVSEIKSTGNRKKFLTSPLPTGVKLMCNVKRVNHGTFSPPTYECYMLEGQKEVFIMASRKRPKNRTSNYILSMDAKDLMDKDSPNFLGKLRSNTMGTTFVVYDNGASVKDMQTKGKALQMRKELASISYEPNLLFNRGPRVMTVSVPAVKETGVHYQFEDSIQGGVLKTAAKNNDRHVVVLKNKKPKWNEQMRAYCLNFHGRVTKASVKNFQLSDDVDGDSVMLQFGKVGQDEFTMDLTYPLSPMQAFGICLSSFDKKKVVD